MSPDEVRRIVNAPRPQAPGRGRRRLLAFALLAPLLPGCARLGTRETEEPPADPAPPTARVIERWEAIGKIAARTDDSEESWKANLHWRQDREDFRLRLSGPFGQGAVQVRGTPGEVELTTAEGERRTAATLEALFREELDWELPGTSLRHWITARAEPGVPVRERTLDDRGRVSSLAQRRWRVEYAYRDGAREEGLPGRVTLRGEGAEVRIAIREWRVP